MRTINTLKNIIANISSVIILTILGFFTRKIFIDSLGVEYLGLNGLLQNVLGMLSLVEGGIGTSIVYNLYKPLANDDRPQIIALVQLYRKIYKYIALAVFALSLCLYPFLDVFIKGGENLSYVSIVYFIFVANNLVGYLMADKWSLINSDQKQYKLAKYTISYQIILYAIKIGILLYFKSFVAYLAVEFILSLIYNGVIIRTVNKLYPYIKTKTKYKVDHDTQKNIVTNVKALFLHSIGGYLLHSTDNIIISTFIGVGVVGLYSNYILIVSQIKALTKPVLTSMKDSIGNLVAHDSVDKQYQIFKTIDLINFFIVGIVIVILYNTLTPFVIWWLGKDYILAENIILVICINYFVDEIRTSVMMYKYVSGIFTADKYVVFITATINLIVSIILVQYMGLIGTLLGTSVALLCTASWNWPRLVYKYTFKKNVSEYYLNYCIRIALLAFCMFTTRYIIKFIIDDTFAFSHILIRGIISVIIFIFIFLLAYIKTPEFQYIKTSINNLIKR